MNKLTDDISEFAKAHCKALEEIKDAKRDKEAYNYEYADLAQVLQIIRPIFTRHGLTIIQGIVSAKEGWVGLETVLLHESGQGIFFYADCRVDAKGDTYAKALGTAVSYLRRYSLMGVAGIAQADSTPEEDGETPKAPITSRQEMQSKMITTATADLIEQLLIESGMSESPGKWIEWLNRHGALSLFDLTEIQAQKAIKKLRASVKGITSQV